MVPKAKRMEPMNVAFAREDILQSLWGFAGFERRGLEVA
jgi:hypothetical protein